MTRPMYGIYCAAVPGKRYLIPVPWYTPIASCSVHAPRRWVVQYTGKVGGKRHGVNLYPDPVTFGLPRWWPLQMLHPQHGVRGVEEKAGMGRNPGRR